MRELDIDGITYVLDLTWYTASSPGVRKDIKSFISSEGFSHGVIHDYISGHDQARSAMDQLTGIKSGRVYQVGATDDEDSKGGISLAKLVSKMTRSTGVYCITINEKEKWVLAVNNGQIVTSTDCVLLDDEARLVISDLAEALIGTHSEETPFVCILDDDELLDIFMDHDDDYVELISSPEHLISSSLIEGDLISLSKQSKVVQLESKAGVFGLLSIVVIGGGYYGYSEYSSNKEMQERLRQQASRVVEQKVPEQEDQSEILDRARDVEIKEFNDSFFSYSNVGLIESAIKLVNGLPFLVSGWKPQEINASHNQLRVSWVTSKGTPLGIVDYLRDSFDSHNFNARGDVVISAMSNDVPKPEVSFDAYSRLPSERDVIYLIDSLKRLGGNSWTVSAPTVKSRDSAIPGINDVRIAMERQAPYREAEFTIKGDGLHKLRSYYKVISEGRSVKIIGVRMSMEDNSWELKGVYYDKK